MLRQAEHRPLTLVIGPPGTGKSFTIAQLILDAVARGQTVLLSSKMNKAVDVVVDKLRPHLGSLTVILRGGDRKYREELRQFLDNLFDGTGAPQKPRPGEIEMLEERLRSADLELARVDGEIGALLRFEEQWSEFARALRSTRAPRYDEAAAEALGLDEIERMQEELRRAESSKSPFGSIFGGGGKKREQIAAEIVARMGMAERDLPQLGAVLQRETARADLSDVEHELARSDDINTLLTRSSRLRADRGKLVGELLRRTAARRAGGGAAAEPAYAGTLQDGA